MNFNIETEDNPKLFQVYINSAWHEVFCYGLAFEESNRSYDKLLFTIVSGSDTALQSIKAAIDIGSYGGLKFGYGEKELTGYKFFTEKTLFGEKGKYEKFSMTLNQNRKALAIVHEDVLNNSKYVLSFDGSPAHDIAQLLGGAKFGLHILPEWEETVLEELINRKYLVEHQLYCDSSLFPEGLSLYSIDLEEVVADRFIENLLQEKLISFPREGTGTKLEELEGLTSYLMDFNGAMVEKLAETVTPTHNPLEHESLAHYSSYPRELFPVQAHTATAVAKRLRNRKSKSVLIQGEMSTGKSSMMTAIADGYHHLKGKKGYHACLMCPPSLTKKWPDEIRELIPHASIHVISDSSQLIAYHSEWTRQGRPEPTVPTFFIISFTTMRGDSRTVPAVHYVNKLTSKQRLDKETNSYKNGFYCPSCGKPHQTVDGKTSELDENGNEVVNLSTSSMTENEFGDTRRIKSGVKPANAFCFHCNESLWTKKVPNRYSGFKEWASHEKRVIHALGQNNKRLIAQVQSEQPEFPKVVGMPRRIATIEYIRRKMRKFFHISIIDEVHELKGGMSAQGNSLGSLVAASKKVVAGTGTLFGGKSADVYFLLWRLLPHELVASGYRYEEFTRFSEEYGNIEETVYTRRDGSKEYSNTNSRGGEQRSSKKIMPGISPFIFGRYMVQNVISVRLKDVWPDPVELVDTPTIFVPMTEELRENYQVMINTFETAIKRLKDGHKLYMPMTDYGIAYPDNPFTFPDATLLTEEGDREIIWRAKHIGEDCTLPKEAKLQEIIETELAEGRKSIVYVRDTGTSVSERDLRPRLKKKLEEIGAKVCILDASTTKTNMRSDWLKQKIEKEGYDVCIVSQELVKVGLDLLCTPTLIYYQFSWSLFTINQSSRRSYRIGQTQECRIFYLAYENSFQQNMAEIIAMKNRATAAINGEVSSDGLSAMLGDEGDLQSMLIQSVKNGGDILKGSAEDWINQTTDRARELLSGIGRKNRKLSVMEQFTNWIDTEIKGQTSKEAMYRMKEEMVENIQKGIVPGFVVNNGVLEVDIVGAFGIAREFISNGFIIELLIKPTVTEKSNKSTKEPVEIISIVEVKTESKGRKKSKQRAAEGQLAFDLFA
ncbi:helicase-related protein [Bacillus cihuensis]|uniref:helicase-related protein n=1 Tax=Bacillus cihuensis TaxID=1208599 RepID=UPI0003F71B06|nr:DEAD/DEAH box helicase [Bacillus cihuensis]